MPHERVRFALESIQNAQSFWPVVGVVGPRQVGKTTLLQNQVKHQTFVTLDDEDVRDAARQSAKVFLAQFPRPLVIDEITKAPALFDGIKSIIDKKRIPNQFMITGSMQFSAKLGIRESLTGRIGIVQLNPFMLAEAQKKPARLQSFNQYILEKPRFSVEEMADHMVHGGMPVPMFLRDARLADDYWQSWLDTTVYRDVARLFTRSFDPEFAFDLIHKMTVALSHGELPSLSLIAGRNPRKAQTYLQAFETVFLVRRLRCHEDGVGKDVWMFFDSGLVHHLLKRKVSDATSISLIRHALLGETSSVLQLQKIRDDRVYYKSAKGSPIDWVWNGVPFKIVTSTKSMGWEEKALIGAMKKLNSKKGYLIAPVDHPILNRDPKKGIDLLSWAQWS